MMHLNIFIQENAFENVCNMAFISFWPQSLKGPVMQNHNPQFWCFLCLQSEQDVEQTVELPVISDAMVLMWHYSDTTGIVVLIEIYTV